MQENQDIFIFSDCGKSFTTLLSLKNHIKTVHEGIKDYICESCNKAFSHLDNLRVHTRTVHEGHRDYMCKGKS